MKNTHNEIAEAEELFGDGARYFDSLLTDIENAQTSIELESYRFAYDSVGRKFINALIGAAKRGVIVRVLIDGIGSSDGGQQVLSVLAENGVRSKIYHPLPWQISHYRWAVKQGSIIGRMLFFIQKINQRDHRKLCIVDNRTLWTGSLNICAQHLSTEDGGDGWRDFGMRITDHRTEQASLTFDAIWNQQTQGLRKKNFRSMVSNLSSFSRRKKYQFITQKIKKAEHRIWISNAYFAPSSTMIRALKQACQRGIEVYLIVPSQSDVFFFPYLTATYYKELIQAGVVIFEYSASFLHAKVLIVDDFFLVGSTNFNHRSFLHDLELDIALITQHAQKSLEQQFIDDINRSTIITQEQLALRGWSFGIGWLARLLRHWL